MDLHTNTPTPSSVYFNTTAGRVRGEPVTADFSGYSQSLVSLCGKKVQAPGGGPNRRTGGYERQRPHPAPTDYSNRDAAGWS